MAYYDWPDGKAHDIPYARHQQNVAYGNPSTPNLGEIAAGAPLTPPPPIPSGYYDPNLDAQRQAASRGLTNTEQDSATSARRAGEDLGTAESGILRDYQRNYDDLGQQVRYSDEDYGRNVQMLTRQYQQQGRQQGEQARKYGVMGPADAQGSIALLSAAKRNENQAIDRQGIDTAYQRAQAGFKTADQRLTEDRNTNLDQTRTTYDRGIADLGTGLGRARSEDVFYGQDIDAQKLYQAQQAGYDPLRRR